MATLDPLERFRGLLHEQSGTVGILRRQTFLLIRELRKENSSQVELAEKLDDALARHHLILRSIFLNVEMPHLEEGSLSKSMTNFFSRLDIGKRSLKIDIDDKIDRFPEISDIFFTISKEGIINAVLHGDAQTISIEVKYQEKAFRLIVKDDGRGFDVEQVLKWASGGIAYIKNLTDSLNGTLIVESNKNTGSVLTVTIPLQG